MSPSESCTVTSDHMILLDTPLYYLKGGVAVAVQQDSDDAHMTFVDGDVQGCLVASIASIQISSGLC